MNSTGMYPRPRESRRRAATLLALGTLLLAACQSGEADVETVPDPAGTPDDRVEKLLAEMTLFGYGLSY